MSFPTLYGNHSLFYSSSSIIIYCISYILFFRFDCGHICFFFLVLDPIIINHNHWIWWIESWKNWRKIWHHQTIIIIMIIMIIIIMIIFFSSFIKIVDDDNDYDDHHIFFFYSSAIEKKGAHIGKANSSIFFFLSNKNLDMMKNWLATKSGHTHTQQSNQSEWHIYVCVCVCVLCIWL